MYTRKAFFFKNQSFMFITTAHSCAVYYTHTHTHKAAPTSGMAMPTAVSPLKGVCTAFPSTARVPSGQMDASGCAHNTTGQRLVREMTSNA